jgi:hypothetical protein
MWWTAEFNREYWGEIGGGSSFGPQLQLDGLFEGCASLARLLGRLLPGGAPLAALALLDGVPSAAASADCRALLSSVRELFIEQLEAPAVGSAADADALLAQMPQLEDVRLEGLSDIEEGFAKLPGLTCLTALELAGMRLSDLPEGPYLAGGPTSLWCPDVVACVG